MSKKFIWLALISSLVAMLAGCNKEEKNAESEISTQAKKSFLFFSQEETDDDGEGIGNLYIHTMDKDSKTEKIASDVYGNSFFYHMEKDYVLYISRERELYKVSLGQAKEKLAEDVDTFDGSSNDNLVLYKNSEEDLYSIDLEKEDKTGEKVTSEVGKYVLKGKNIYYMSKDDDLIFYNTEKHTQKTIAEEVYQFEFNGKSIIYTDEDNMLFYKENEDSDSTKITGDEVSLGDVIKDKNDIYFISNENDDRELNVVNTKDLGNPKNLASEVEDYDVINGEVIYSTDENNLFSKAKESDTSKKLASDIDYFLVNNGVLCVVDKEKTLFRIKDNELEKLASKVKDWSIINKDDVIYNTPDKDLFINDKKIKSDVQKFLNVDDFFVFATDEKKLYYQASVNEEAKVISDELDKYSTVSYFNIEMYYNTLGFKDTAGYWSGKDKDDDTILVKFEENGKFSEMVYGNSVQLRILENTADLTSFSVAPSDLKEDDTDYEIIDMTLNNDVLSLYDSDSELKASLEKVTKSEMDKLIKAYKEDAEEEARLEREAEEAREEERLQEEVEEVRDELTSFMEDYFDFFEEAMEYGDISGMSEWLSMDADIYDEQKAYIERVYDKGTTIEEVSTEITDITKVSNYEYQISVLEDYIIYKADGSESNDPYTNVYTVELDDDDEWHIIAIGN